MKKDFNQNITSILEDNPFVTSYKFNLDTGYGTMVVYHLFGGIDLIYNDFNAENCNQLGNSDNFTDYIIINHCRKGRFETVFQGNYIFLSEGDLVFSSGTKQYSHNFSLGFYSGLQILINLKTAQRSIDNILGEDIINIRGLADNIRDNGSFAIIRSSDDVEHVISELYDVDDNIKRAYYKLKVIELLLFLKNNEIKSLTDELPSLKSDNVLKIKEIRQYLIANISEKITYTDLSKKFNISISSIKNYFKIIYGKPLFTWLREYRLNQAASYLKNTDKSIAEISEVIGYKDHGKFTKAFKQYYDMTPMKYKKSH